MRGVTSSLIAFVAAATIVIIAPGPDSLLVLRNTMRGGRASGSATALGVLTGLLTWAVVAALGLTALLAASRIGYDVLRYAGAAYLVWLGLTSIFARTPSVARSADAAPAPRRGHNFLTGLASNLLNPKIGVFFVAFLPAFLPTGAPAVATSLLFGVLFVVETALWFAVLLWLFARGAGWLRRPAVQVRIQRLAGVVLVGFGIRVATQAR